MDLYRHFAGSEKTEKQLVTVGRTVSLTAMVIALIVAKPLLGNFTQAFQYIQEFTGLFTPGVCALFLLGFLIRLIPAYLSHRLVDEGSHPVSAVLYDAIPMVNTRRPVMQSSGQEARPAV